mgnify:CR=1 FL=1
MTSVCITCGTRNADDDNYCSNCGAPLPSERPTTEQNKSQSTSSRKHYSPPPPRENPAEAAIKNPPPPPIDETESPPATATKNYAGFIQRGIAAFIDYLLIQMMVIVSLATAEELHLLDHMDELSMALISIATLPIVWLYHAGLEASALQGTLGKRTIGIKVTDEQGRRCHLGQTTKRFFGKFLSALILGLGFLMMIPSPRNQTLHDKLAGCLVMKR